MFFAPSDRRERAKFVHDLQRLFKWAPASFEALAQVKKCLLFGSLPEPGSFSEQPFWFRSTSDWLLYRGMLEGPFRGGL